MYLRIILGVLIFHFCSGALLLAASSTLTFGPGVQVGLGVDSYSEPSLAGDGMGHWVSVWDDYVDVRATRSVDNGKSWTPVVFPSVITTGTIAGRFLPSVATDGKGNWVAVWEAYVTGVDINRYRIYAVRSVDNGASWSNPIPIHATDFFGNFDPHIEADSSGRFGVVFNYVIPWQVWLIRSEDAGLTWSDLFSFEFYFYPPADYAISTQFSMDNSGNWMALCGAYPGADVLPKIFAANSTDAGTSWTNYQTIALGHFPGAMQSAVRPTRRVVVYMDSKIEAQYYPHQIRMTSSTDNGTTWSVPLVLDAEPDLMPATSSTAINPMLASDGAGTLLALWRLTFKPGGRVMGLRSTDDGASWQPVAIQGLPDCAVLKPDGQGNWAALWTDASGKIMFSTSTATENVSAVSPHLYLKYR